MAPIVEGPFDPRRHRLRKRRAAAGQGFADASFLQTRAAVELLERLEAINRPFPRVLALGGGAILRPALAKDHFVVAADMMEQGADIAIDPERLPFASQSFDLVLAPLSLGWVNDLPGALVQLRLALRPDGLLMATLFGPETLRELRAVLIEAEAELTGGAALRIAPFPEIREAAGLLQRAGFALPAADREVATVRYRDPFRLLQDLRAMGETAAFAQSAPPLRREVVARAMALYQERYAFPDGRVPATFEAITLTGWAPHDSQQKPLAPGSAKTRLADALGVAEQSAGDTVKPES
jgi:SAM-dependent methyltransferase